MGDEQEVDEVDETEETDTKIEGKSFTQEQVSNLMTKEKDQGRRQGRKEVLEKLGFKTLEDAEAFRKTLQDAEAAQLSEVERARREAEQERQTAQQERDAAQAERFAAKLERALLRAGVPDTQVNKVARMVSADVDSSDEDITAAVADLKDELPQLFTPAGEEQDPKPPHSDPGKPGAKKPPASDSKQRARDRLKARHGDRIKS